jgi:hypothetical protein
MERRGGSHTEEEELNQRKRLLNLARKGDPKAINRLFELYQVRVYSGEALNKKNGRLPSWPTTHPTPAKATTHARTRIRVRTRVAGKPRRPAGSRRVATRKSRRKRSHR